MRDTFAGLLAERAALNSRIEHSAQRTYPIGCHVSWRHGDHVRRGEIIAHGYGTRMKVRTYSGAEVWRDAESFVGRPSKRAAPGEKA